MINEALSTRELKAKTEDTQPETANKELSIIRLNYILQIAGFFVGFTFIVALVVALIKRPGMETTLAKSHISWQLRTATWGLAWTIVGLALCVFLIGYMVLLINYTWVIYRVTVGLLALSDKETIGNK